MSDRMHPIPFPQLLNWVMAEWRDSGSVFGCHKIYHADPERYIDFVGHRIETPVGPAAGPNTQLAQNIVAAYVCGGRIFELKTVQVIDGEDLHVSKPCILAEDEGYNCEWSTELTVPQAFEEYVKAWFLLNLLSKELELGRQDGFAFNMSVGYDLAGIQSKKIDDFIEGLKDASQTRIFKRCKQQLLDFLPRCKRMTAEDVEAISPHICDNISLSTMHGCPAGEIERIALYLIEEKGLNLFLKCNPTLLGYDHVRQALDDLGFQYIQFTREQFDNDLQYADAVPMLRRLRDRSAQPPVRGEAHQHLPGEGAPGGAAGRDHVHERPHPAAPEPGGGGKALRRVRRPAAHLLLRRRQRPEHRLHPGHRHPAHHRVH